MTFTKLEPQGHEGKTNVWLTPRWILNELGEFDLDPCAHQGWPTAYDHFYENGLLEDWYGRVWLNPPYGRNVGQWLNKLELHGNGIALIFARTDTSWFQSLSFEAANFVKGRIKFLNQDLKESTNAGVPSVLLAWGEENIEAIKNIKGIILRRDK